MIQDADLKEILQLEKPLACIDVETHDKCPPEQAHIVEMGLVMFYPDERPTRRWSSLMRLPEGVVLHPGATEVHGITPAMLEETREFEGKIVPKYPTFSQAAPNLAGGLRDCDYFGYNVTFDIGCITTGMKRAGVQWSAEGAVLLDPFLLWKKLCKRTNSDFVREYAGREPSGAHRALNDIQDTIDGFFGFARKFQLPSSVPECMELCKEQRDPTWIDEEGKFKWNSQGVAVCNFGKRWNGYPMNQVGSGFYTWMLEGNFLEDAKQLARDAIKKKFPVKG
jgi:hypothetical protein